MLNLLDRVSPTKLMIGFLAVIAVVVGILIYFMVKDANEWKAWCAAQGGRVEESTATGVGPSLDGKGSVAITTSITYYCLTEDGRLLGVK